MRRNDENITQNKQLRFQQRVKTLADFFVRVEVDEESDDGEDEEDDEPTDTETELMYRRLLCFFSCTKRLQRIHSDWSNHFEQEE